MEGSDAAKARPELVEKIGELARATGSSADELVRAVQAYRELERWQLEAIDEAIAEADSGVPGIPHEEVMAEIRAMIDEGRAADD